MKKLIIIGASGHGKVISDIAKLNGYTDIVFLDDNPEIKSCGDYPVAGKTALIKTLEGDVVVGIGNALIRKRILEAIPKSRVVSLIHPNAVIGSHVEIGRGTVVMAGAVINYGSTIGKGCIINTCASVDHDCVIGDYVHVAVGSHLCGTVSVGENTWVGAGSTVSNNVSICADCVIGAGAAVVKDISEAGTYVGVPARQMK